MRFTRKKLKIMIAACAFLAAPLASAGSSDHAYKIKGKVVTIEDVQKDSQSQFYDIEKKKYDLVDQAARQAYLDSYWEDKAKQDKTSVEAAKNAYFKKNIRVSDKEIDSTLKQFKDHPQLSKLSESQQKEQIRGYLEERSKRSLIEEIISAGIAKKDLVVLYPKPQEPVYEVKVASTDHVRYRATGEYSKPVKCKGDDCLITVIEYSEFQCPFCARVLDDVERIMKEYEGKIRWVVRDYPLSFHDRARPAAIAAKCAAKQNKYWNMYKQLFDNQKKLGDSDFESYAKDIGIDVKKWKACYDKPGDIEMVIDTNFDSGSKLGVTGTPAFFINGRKLSGALPYSDFKRVIEEELDKKNKKA